MWVMHPRGGFLSAVQHNTNPDLLVIRARVKADLDDLTRVGDVTITGGDPNTDYPWRAIVPRGLWTGYVAHLAQSIDYGNFKDTVSKTDPERAHAYSDVWTALLALEDLDPDQRSRRLYWPRHTTAPLYPDFDYPALEDLHHG